MIEESRYISRDLSWLKFNYRVLEQASSTDRTILERLKFIAITAANLDEFMMVRVGSLFSYLDYDRKRVDYSGLREGPFKDKLFEEIQKFTTDQTAYFQNALLPEFEKNGLNLERDISKLGKEEQRKIAYYFTNTIYPMLTPMIYDTVHPFPVLTNKALIFGVKSVDAQTDKDRFSFVQVPQNLPRFYEIVREDKVILVPIEDIIRMYIDRLYKGVEMKSATLLRLTRNADFTLYDYDEGDNEFIEELERKLKGRRKGRVVRIETEEGASVSLLKMLRKKLKIGKESVFVTNSILDYTALWSVVGNSNLQHLLPNEISSVKPLGTVKGYKNNILGYLEKNDLFLHHPYHDMDPVMRMLEGAAVDPAVLAIKITIYRLAKNSRVTKALLLAAENGKHISVLFEVKARFDEANNIKEGKKLQKAGCHVIYGVKAVKTHTKLMLIVRQNKKGVTRFVHMSSGNYNESTAKIYTDTSFLTAKPAYGHDISEFFNVITGHSVPPGYKKMITTPGDMRAKLIRLIRREVTNIKKGKPAGIVIKVNSIEDQATIDELYKASNAGVEVRLIVRGICCLRPGRKGLSENITVKSVVGDYLEHSRIYYFHNAGKPSVYGGSADVMNRSFDRRIESLFLVEGFQLQQMMNILDYSWRDTVNSYYLQENGDYIISKERKKFNIHKEFYKVDEAIVLEAKLFD